MRKLILLAVLVFFAFFSLACSVGAFTDSMGTDAAWVVQAPTATANSYEVSSTSDGGYMNPQRPVSATVVLVGDVDSIGAIIPNFGYTYTLTAGPTHGMATVVLSDTLMEHKFLPLMIQ